jgi:23S rRNA (guanosine2251-2'-O)-methyltransferase
MIIYGKNTVLEAIRNHRTITRIFLANHSDVETMVKKELPQVDIEMKTTRELDELCDQGNHQGIACEIMNYQYKKIETIVEQAKDKENVTLVALDGLEDPHNLGAILRTADATQMDAIILPKNRSVGLNSTVAKVSTGAIEHVAVAQVTNLVQTLKELKKNGYWVIGLELDGSVDYRKQDYHGKIVVIIGSEGKGISRLVKEECDYLVNIPMHGYVNSLNASVSAALLFYEVIRNRE